MTRRTTVTSITALACVLVLLLAVTTAAFRLGARTGPGTLPEEFTLLAELYERVVDEAVEVPADRVLVEGAMRGLLETLGDPYAVYYDPEAFTAFSELLDGSFSGVGLMLEARPDGLEIVNVLPGTPAEAGGIQAGELIVSVEGRDVSTLPIEVVVRMVQGEAGTDVRLGLKGHPDGPREVTLTRARIEFPTVEARLLEDGSGYVRLLQFSQGSAQRVRDAIEGLLADGASGIVLDLRGNPGGLLHEGVRVASIFIPEGPIVSVQERDRERDVFQATGDAFADLPLVLLVDQGSASASEIVAGALQDYRRAQLVGTKTFGKGTVQTVRILSDGSGAKFTTAEYFTPSGDTITGLLPDREVADAEQQLAVAQELLRALVVGGAEVGASGSGAEGGR